MTDMNFGFNDVENQQTHTGSRGLPDSGDYNVMISDIEMKSNNKGNGHNIEVTYSILDGDFAGAEVKEWLAVINRNETAQNIAQSKLKSIYITTNNTSAKSFTELQGAVLKIRIYKKENTYVDDNGNERDGYNTEVAMYMNTKGENAAGKDVPEYSGPAVIPAKNQKNKSSSSNVDKSDPFATSNRSSSNQNDDDDEIPF